MKPNNPTISEKLISLLNESAIPCETGDTRIYEKITHLIGDARLVLMGEASHGTQEFYEMRAALTQYLIKHKGFQAIAIEGDCTSAYQIHRYCQGQGDTNNPQAALDAFKRFPNWMWRNTVILDLIKELRQHNDQCQSKIDKIGFYGLDLYCLNESIQAVINYLQWYHPETAEKAIERYACFDHTHTDPQLYGYLIEERLKYSCIREVTTQLLETQHLIYQHLAAHGDLDEKEKQFYITQNARVVKNAEHYYRALFEPRNHTWNIRDEHMTDTLQNIISHLESITDKPAKIIVWAHNSHIGDARATEMSERKEINLGQLVRERFNTSSFLLGFSTAEGTVTAASQWDGPATYKTVKPPFPGSYEWLFHQLNQKNFLLNLREDTHLTHLLKSPQLQRAIGVIYKPETERMSHYFFSHLPYQFDAIIHFDKTTAVTPIDNHKVSSAEDMYSGICS